MMNSRTSGDAFEYSIAKYLYNEKLELYDDESKNKFRKLSEKKSDRYISIHNDDLKEVFAYLNIDNYNKIKFTTDNDGKRGNVADIELYKNDGTYMGLSCKVNNISLKHQRPSALFKQCDMEEDQSSRYRSDYKKCNNKWYNILKQHKKFNEVDENLKKEMYKDFNELTKQYLETLDPKQITYFYKFLIEYDKICILKLDTRIRQLTTYKYLDNNDPKRIKSIKVNNNHININFDNGIDIDLRLHNASSQIKKVLAMKYDTKVLTTKKLFDKQEFELKKSNFVAPKNKTKNKNKEYTNMSVLRYPGGKSRAIKTLIKYVPNDIDELYSPFFGGGSFEFSIQKKYNIPVYANDKFEPLFNFWSALKKNNTRLINEVKNVHPITKDKFLEYKKDILNTKINRYVRGAYYYAVNRSSFSGSTTSGGYSPDAGKSRFNEASIERLKEIDLTNIDFSNEDFSYFMNEIPNDKFIFLDPPYYLENKSKLYGVNGDLHEDFDHKKLYNCLKKKKLWLLCYNDCEYIKDLYDDYKIITVSWKYGMNKTKESSEIIILSKDLTKKLEKNKTK